MAAAHHWYRWDGADLVIEALIQPRAAQDAFGPVLGERLKIRLTAPPVDGKANDHLMAFLAALFRVPRRAVTIETGATGRRKRIRIVSPGILPPPLGIPPPARR